MSELINPIVYDRPSGSTITVEDTLGNREQAASLGWKLAEPEDKPKRGRKPKEDAEEGA